MAAALAVMAVGCSARNDGNTRASAAEKAAKQKSKKSMPLVTPVIEPIDLATIRFVGMDDGPVPEFKLKTVDGRTFASQDVVGDRPFVFVFVATWCSMCDKKLTAVRRGLDRLGPVTVIAVAVDDAETWQDVEPFLQRHKLAVPVVPAVQHPQFALSYNPFFTVPLVVVVGRNGGLVDYQLGYGEDDEERFVQAVRLARRIGPLKSSGT